MEAAEAAARAFLAPDETGAAFLSRNLTDPMLTGIPFVDAHGSLRAGQMLEVCGVGGSGKTEILMQAAVNCALPKARGGVSFGGCEGGVLLLDLDGKFDTLRFLKILTSRVKDAVIRGRSATMKQNETAAGAPSQPRKTPPLDAESEALIDAVYAECVGRFHMLRCHGSLDFLKALTVVERAFVEAEAERERRDAADASADDAADASAARTRARAQTQTRRLLLIDNIAAFYWLDRASRREQGAPLSLHAVHHAFAAKLLALSRKCRAPIVVTKATVGGGGTGATQTHKDFLPPTWTSAVTQRLVLDVEKSRGGGPHGGGVSFVARWDFPRGRSRARYDVDGDEGIKCRAA